MTLNRFKTTAMAGAAGEPGQGHQGRQAEAGLDRAHEILSASVSGADIRPRWITNF